MARDYQVVIHHGGFITRSGCRWAPAGRRGGRVNQESASTSSWPISAWSCPAANTGSLPGFERAPLTAPGCRPVARGPLAAIHQPGVGAFADEVALEPSQRGKQVKHEPGLWAGRPDGRAGSRSDAPSPEAHQQHQVLASAPSSR
jgi:hypothetical protein